MPGRDGHGRSGSSRGTAELVSLAAVLFLGLLSGPSTKAAESEKATPAYGASAQDIQVPAPPLSEGIFPCSGCHAGQKTNRQRRKLTEMHQDIVLEHGPESRWCFDCHDPDDRDELRLASGERIGFSRSYPLCGQCHGDKYRDWKVGVHGKRTGEWNGKKQYLLCVHCHDPHSPRFKPLKPLPAPVLPEAIRTHERTGR